MFAVTVGFPLTSDQPPLAVADPAVVMQQQPGRAGPAEPVRPSAQVTAPAGSEAPDPWRLDPARDPFVVIGPPPAFEANVLEAERTLESKLARLELARSRAELQRGGVSGELAEADPATAAGDTPAPHGAAEGAPAPELAGAATTTTHAEAAPE